MAAGTKPKSLQPQKIRYFSDALAIFSADFPIYYVESISERHVIIAGGGGSSKTGVHNQINVLELVPTGESCAAELVTKYQTPDEIPDAIMSGALMRDLPIVNTRLVAAGENATIYHIQFDQSRKSFSVVDHEILADNKIKSELKCVKYTPSKILAGCIDGTLISWSANKVGNVTNLDKQLKAHSKEIDDIDVDLVSQQVVTLSRGEGRLALWSLDNLKLIREFKKDIINVKTSEQSNMTYSYRACKFASDTSPESTKNNSNRQSFLLVACNPIPAKEPSKIYKWCTNDMDKFTSQPVTMDGIMAMSISSDGKHVAIGTRSGGISVFEVKNLRKIYNIDGAHHNAVTNLEFLPSKQESLNLTNSKLCPLLSVSIDRRVILHRPKRRSLITGLLKILVMMFVIYFMFFAFQRLLIDV